MAEPVEWDAGGTPRSARFDDIYRSSSGGLAQARRVFLSGCDLPAAWAARPHWCILETGFGLGLNFLAAWRAWKDDPARCGMLHFVSVEAWPVGAEDLLRSASASAELLPLANELASQWWGLVGGFHRLRFEGGRVLLTLCVGDVRAMLKELSLRADSVFLDGFSPEVNPAMWNADALKRVSRLCRRGTRVATWTVTGEVRRDLEANGFVLEKAQGLAPKRHCLRGVYEPRWEVPEALDRRLRRNDCPSTPPSAPCPSSPPRRGSSLPSLLIVGAGLSGAAAANAFATRGWQVEIVDANTGPGQAASGLPAGLLAPHQSPDDNPLSRLSRAGVRTTLHAAQSLDAHDWQLTGAVERRFHDARPPPDLGPAGLVWTRAEGGDWRHDQAAWVRPAALVEHWLRHENVTFRGGVRVARLLKEGDAWIACDASGAELARATLVILAAALDTQALAGDRLTLRPVRGQVTWRPDPPEGLPATPLNGNGHFIPAAIVEGRPAWLTGSTYVRGDTSTEVRGEEHAANLERLRTLCPQAASLLAPEFARANAWTGVRCASTDRRPVVGFVDDGLAVLTALGSRGLTFAALCAELLAARVHGEPLPVEKRLADALDLARLTKGSTESAPSPR